MINKTFYVQDRTPLEAEPPVVQHGLDRAASKLFEGKVQVSEAASDPYAAQLAKSKAAKIQSAEKVLQKAANDPKVVKAIQKKQTGRGRGRGRGRGNATKTTEEDMAEVADVDPNALGADGVADASSKSPPQHETKQGSDGAAVGAQHQWLEKERVYSKMQA